MAYSHEQLTRDMAKAWETPETFYTQPFIKNARKIKSERVTEIVAKEILDNFDNFRNGIKPVNRHEVGKSYFTPNHLKLAQEAKAVDLNSKSRKEEWFAKKIHGKTFNIIGEIIDFQTPLYASDYKKMGKIDLLSFNGHDLYILELKWKNSGETLLRCVLEAYTYYATIEPHKGHLFDDFRKQYPKIPATAKLRKGILVFDDCRAYKDYTCVNNPEVCKLVEKLEVEVFVLDAIGKNIVFPRQA